MAFDQPTRNRLARFVGDARRILTEEFTRQCKQDYGIDPDTGEVSDISRLTHLNDSQRASARILRDTIDHYVAGSPSGGKRVAIERIIREQAFTVFNRLCAIRMAEAREILIESVGKGYQSKGFQLYARVAGHALGEVGDAYRCFLFSVFDEIATDLPSLFDRFSQQGRLFPAEGALLKTLAEINHPDIDPLWAEDETIGWLYQYFNSIEERKKMRDESAAPRNSRELAVRNQFFTPRYVVEFLTDNTLGRLWYEMTKGESRLKEECRYLVRRPTEIFLKEGEAAPPADESAAKDLSQEELLRQPVFVPHRPLKDPRDIRLLDPACGSMHFGLYAFDLFERIYDEAWDIADGSDESAKSAETFAPFVAFAATFPDKTAFGREVPRLIVERNVHGIDIDPRAVQIAGLSLWLRAQRAWHQAGVKPADRPQITRSNVVCAEPMPGETQLLGEFIQRQFPAAERGVFNYLLEKVFNCMKLAGEAGSLVRVEEEIRAAIAETKSLWQQVLQYEQSLLFVAAGETSAPRQMRLNLSSITDDQFWGQAEQRIYDALEAYSEQAESGGAFQRRLFAEDAAQGFAFIDICRKRYDVAVINPPFGLMPGNVYRYLVSKYRTSYSDLALTFMVRGSEWCSDNGFVGAITSRAFLNVSDAEKFRRSNALHHLRLLADLGVGVMDDAFVDASAQVLSASREAHLWIKDARKAKDKDAPLCAFLANVPDSPRFLFPHSHFETIPKCRFVYDSGEGLGTLLSSINSLEPVYGIARTGASTFEDDRFLRLIWEIGAVDLGPEKTWCWIARTAPEFCQFYYLFEVASKWNRDGAELCERNRQVNDQVAQARQGSSHYFKAGIVFSRRSRSSISFRVHPSGIVFSFTCGVVFPARRETTLFLMGVLNFRFIRAAIHTLTTYSYTVGHIRAILAPPFEEAAVSAMSILVIRIIMAKQKCFRLQETDHFFYPAEFPEGVGSLKVAHERLSSLIGELETQMLADEQALDTSVSRLYKLDDNIYTARFGIEARNVTLPKWLTKIGIEEFVGKMVSEAVGSAFGRWDIRYATGERPAPELPDPFAPLPVCPPGMLQCDDGLPLSNEEGCRLRAEGKYPLDVAWHGILVDDADHPLDVEHRVRAALVVI